MCPKRIEQRQRVNLDEIVEAGEQMIMEMLEIKGNYYPVQVIDDDCIAAASSKFALPNEEMSRTISLLEGIDDETAAAVDEARSQSEAVSGLSGISEKEIELPNGEDESLLSAVDEASDLYSCFREAEDELAHINASITELSIEDLAKMFE